MLGVTSMTTAGLLWLSVAGPGSWQTLAPLPAPRQEVGVATLAGRIYAVGGFDVHERSVNTVERYDPVSNTWQRMAPLPAPQPLNHVGAASLAGRLYVIGGLRQDFSPVSTLYIFNAQTGQWSAGAPMPTARGAVGVGVIDGLIYVAGGFPLQRAADFTVFDPVSNRWWALPRMPTGRDHLGAAVVDGKFYAIGGRVSGVLRHQVEEYDPRTRMWRSRARMPTARGGLAVAAVGGRIYAFGGEGNPGHPSGVFPQVEEFIPALNQWRALPFMPFPRHGIGAGVYRGVIYLPGGADVRQHGAVATHDAFWPP